MKTGFIAIAAVLFLANAAAYSAPAPETDNNKRLVIVDSGHVTGHGQWEVEDDVVMGGVSQGYLFVNSRKNAVFTGNVSLENNGGFSSVQYHFEPIDVSSYRKAFLQVKGDGKAYRFLVEATKNARHYYQYDFQTTGDWQIITVPLKDMYPVFRGDRLSIPSFPGKTLAMIRFLIGNNREEKFRLEIKSIWLE